MPPHDDVTTTFVPTTDTITGNLYNLHINAEDLRNVITTADTTTGTTAGTATIDDLTGTNTFRGRTFTTNTYDWTSDVISPAWLKNPAKDDIEKQVEEQMEKYARKIYNLVKEIVKLNVTEDEFIELLNETE